MSESNTQKKGKTVTIVILVLLLLGAAGYIVYDKFIAKESTTTKEEAKTEESSFNLENKTELQVLYTDNMDFIVDQEGDVYLALHATEDQDDAIKKSITELQKENDEYTIEGYNETIETCDTEGAKNNTFTGIKLDLTDVVAAYETKNGQDIDGYYIVFIKEDGTISALRGYDALYESKITLTDNVGDLKDIVSVIQSSTSNGCSDGYQAIAIDKNAKQYPITFKETDES